jgi:hypothetical protein
MDSDWFVWVLVGNGGAKVGKLPITTRLADMLEMYLFAI